MARREEPLPAVLASEPVGSAWLPARASPPTTMALVPADHPLTVLWTTTRTQVLAVSERRAKRKRLEESREIEKRQELDEMRAEHDALANRALKAKQAQAAEEAAKSEAERNAARQSERERMSKIGRTVTITSDF